MLILRPLVNKVETIRVHVSGLIVLKHKCKIEVNSNVIHLIKLATPFNYNPLISY
jgi:hypothetical protein